MGLLFQHSQGIFLERRLAVLRVLGRQTARQHDVTGAAVAQLTVFALAHHILFHRALEPTVILALTSSRFSQHSL